MVDESHNGKRWLVVGVAVPIAVAVIGSLSVIVEKAVDRWGTHSSPTSSAAPSTTTQALPAADPIPASWCFECNPHLITIARECREGSMNACDDLWKTIVDPTDKEDAAIHDDGVSCGGRRQLKAPGYRYKDCADEFPGHS